MRKVTASAVILTALTGCSQSKGPSAQWSFEVPANTTTTSTQKSTFTDSTFTDSTFTDGSPAQRSGPALPASASAQKTSFVGNPTSGKMGPAFEQPMMSAESSGVATLGLTSQKSSGTSGRINANSTVGTIVPSLLSPGATAQTRSYLATSLRSPVAASPVMSYRAPFSRVPFSAQAHIPAAPNYSAASASYEALAPVPFTAPQPDAALVSPATLLLAAPERSENLLLPQVSTQLTPERLEASPFLAAAPVTLSETAPTEENVVAIAQPIRAAPNEITPIEIAPAEATSTEVKLARLLQTLPHHSEPTEVTSEPAEVANEPTDAIGESTETNSEPAILAIIRADQQARQATSQGLPALAAEQMPTLTTHNLATVEPVIETDSTATVSPLLEELQSAVNSAPLQAVYVPIPETSAADRSATFILEAIAALSEEANAAPLSVLSSAQLPPTPAQPALLELTLDAPEPNALQPGTPTATLVRLESAPTESALTDVQATPEAKVSIEDMSIEDMSIEDMSIEPAKVMEAYRKGAYSALEANRLQPSNRIQSRNNYRQRIVWQ